MSSKRKTARKNTRRVATRSYRKLVLISCEGTVTEPQYFEVLKNKKIPIKIISNKNHNSSPEQVLKRMEDYLKKNRLQKTDEAWLVVDKDNWNKTQLKPLYQWSKQANNHKLAVSNPNFEFWLLLHFEDGQNASDSKTCLDKLKKYLPNYDKNINAGQITSQQIKKAIDRAKTLYQSNNKGILTQKGSTVYELVESILN